MKLNKEKQDRAYSIKVTAQKEGQQVGRAYLYMIYNDLHDEPYGLLEDVKVQQDYRGQGIGTQLVEEIIEEAKNQGCYKLIATSRDSRPEIHDWYEKLGFDNYGREFRMDFNE
ncbi:MAG: GNAT family N-acetyltransferase [Candidatus Magasanikbacteria bacterium]